MNEIGLENWEILPLLSRMCGIKTIREVEKNWIRILNADLNIRSPITDQKEYKAVYYENNKNKILQKRVEYYEYNRGTNRFRCNICNITGRNNYDLKTHFGTLKHSYAWLNSLD